MRHTMGNCIGNVFRRASRASLLGSASFVSRISEPSRAVTKETMNSIGSAQQQNSTTFFRLHGRGRSYLYNRVTSLLAFPRRTNAQIALVSLVVASICVLVLTPAAFAARGHLFQFAFGVHVNKTAVEEGRAPEEDVCPAPGHPTDVCQSGEAGSAQGQLSSPGGLAVNEATDTVYVLDRKNDRVEYFDGATGTYLGDLAPPAGGSFHEGESEGYIESEGIAVDNSSEAGDPSKGDIYVVDEVAHVDHVVDKFSSAGVYIGRITGAPELSAFPTIYGLAVDSKGRLWVANEGDDQSSYNANRGVYLFSNALSNQPIEFISAAKVFFDLERGFAVDSKNDFYIRYSFIAPYPIWKFGHAGEVLDEAVGGEYDQGDESKGLATELSSDDLYINTQSSVRRLSSTGSLLETLTTGTLTHGTGVAVDSASGDVYASDFVGNLIDVFSPEPPGHPTIEPSSESVVDVSSNTATLIGEINPRSEPKEPATEYSFEYGACASSSACPVSPYTISAPSPVGRLAPDYELNGVSVSLEGLLPHTTYHFRLRAHNSHGGSVEGEEVIFATQDVGSFAPLDGRVWELVSPPNKQGADLEPIGEQGVIQAAADGNALTYLANSPTEPDPEGNALLSQVLAARGAGRWSSRDIAVPHGEQSGISLGAGNEYRFFSEDLSHGFVQPFGPSFVPLSGEASEQTAYLRTDFAADHESEPCSGSCYTPLVSAANVPAGTEFGSRMTNGEECSPKAKICGPMFDDANPDGTAVVLSSFTPLVEGAPRESLYEWSDGDLLPINGGGEVGGLGNGDGITKSARGAVSADGSRVVTSISGGHLYSTDMGTGERLLLDKVQGGSGAGGVSPVFQLASADGSRVFFTDQQALTAGAGTIGGNEGKSDLYECAIVEQGGEPVCDLSDLTPLTGSGESADVEGSVIGASESGESVYFVANGVLGSNSNDHSETAAQGSCLKHKDAFTDVSATCNLYVYRDGVTTFIARLSEADGPDWATALNHLTARVSPNGEWLAFMSERSLTGYDNRDASTGEPDEEVFVYHEGRGAGEAGSLVCASCNPTGARPHGQKYEYDEKLVLAGGDRIWDSNIGLAANIPGWTPYKLGVALYQSRYLSDSGRLFFNSSDDLVPQDTNGTEDVYEYEPLGSEAGAAASDTCATASFSYSSASKGCVDLISSGASPEESAFLDASESGDDVFFLTAAQLSPRDPDTSLDVYDARADGVEPPVARPVECQGDACQAFVAPPEELTPGSLIHSGPGNPAPAMLPSKVAQKTKPLTQAQKLARALRACAKQKKHKRRAACERQARRAFGSKKPADSKKSAGKSSRRGGR